MQIWFNNNDHVKVNVGPYRCTDVEFISSRRVRCALPPGVGRMYPITVQVKGRLPAPIPLTPNKLRIMHAESMPPEAIPGVFFSYDKPEIHSVKPSFLLDFPQVGCMHI